MKKYGDWVSLKLSDKCSIATSRSVFSKVGPTRTQQVWFGSYFGAGVRPMILSGRVIPMVAMGCIGGMPSAPSARSTQHQCCAGMRDETRKTCSRGVASLICSFPLICSFLTVNSSLDRSVPAILNPIVSPACAPYRYACQKTEARHQSAVDETVGRVDVNTSQ